jgi:hypothetical protein
MLSFGAYVIIWDEMLSSGMQCYHLELMLSSGANVIIWDKMLSCGANVVMLSFGANVIIWCFHVMLSSGMITPPYFIFPENFTHSKIGFYFFQAISSDFGFKVSKKCSHKQKKLNFSRIRYLYHKMQNLMLSSNPLKKCKKQPKKVYRPKTFAHSYNSQKLHFSVTFSLITFLHELFAAIRSEFRITKLLT